MPEEDTQSQEGEKPKWEPKKTVMKILEETYPTQENAKEAKKAKAEH